MKPLLPPTTSASQLVMYSMCPRRYALQYVYQCEPEFISIALVIGSVLHSIIGWWFEEKLSKREPPRAAASQMAEIDLLALTAGKPVRYAQNQTFDDLLVQTVALIQLYLDTYGALEVTAIEEELLVPLVTADGSPCGRPLKGYLDLRLATERIVEIKTSARGWSEASLFRHLQLGAYRYAMQQGAVPGDGIDIHVLVKLKRAPRIETYALDADRRNLGWWLSAVRAIESAIASLHFPPAPGPMCVQCEYAKACARWTESVPEASCPSTASSHWPLPIAS